MDSSFNPLGNFNPDAPLALSVLADVRASVATPALPAGFAFHREYFHWSVAGFGCIPNAASWLSEYNYVVDLYDGKWHAKMTHNPLDNLAGFNQSPMAEHTWHRNSNAIGIAVNGMLGATETNFGPDPINAHEIEYLCATAGVVAHAYDLDLAATVAGPSGNAEPLAMTHAECATADGYPYERWDLLILKPDPIQFDLGGPLRRQYEKLVGDALRHRARQYKMACA